MDVGKVVDEAVRGGNEALVAWGRVGAKGDPCEQNHIDQSPGCWHVPRPPRATSARFRTPELWHPSNRKTIRCKIIQERGR